MRVLIVDDEPLIRRSLSRAFAKANHSVHEAADGKEATQLFESETYDVILLDVLMPDVSGPDLLLQWRGRVKCPVILMSAHAGRHVAENAKDLGAADFFSKPFDDIFKVVDRVVEIVEQNKV